MKNYIYVFLAFAFVTSLFLGCGGGDDSLSTLSVSDTTAVIEGYVMRDNSVTPAPKKSFVLEPTPTESAFVNIKVMLEGSDKEAITDATGYFKLVLNSPSDFGLKKLKFTDTAGTKTYGECALNIYENDKKLYRMKITQNKNVETISVDPNDKNTIINRLPIVDAGPDVYTSNFSSDYIKIMTQYSYDPDGTIKKVYIDIGDDGIMDREDIYRSSYAITDRQKYFATPGDYKVVVYMVDNMGGVGEDYMYVHVSPDYRLTNFKPIAFVDEQDGVRDGVLKVKSGNITLKGDGIDYDLVPGGKLKYRWVQKSGPTVAINNDSQEISFFASEGNTYEFSLYVNDGIIDSDPYDISVIVEGQGDDNGGQTGGGTSVGKIYFEASNVIYELNTYTGDERSLTDSSYISLYPAVSPDNTALIFSSNKLSETSENFDLYSLSFSSLNIGRITSTVSTESFPKDEFMPFYAKNSKIYFVYNGGSSIYSISANGGDLYEELTFSGKMIKYPAVNKDANKIVFVSNRDTSGNYELFTADLNEQGHIDENSLTKINLSISYDDALYPSYSPDGSKILLCCKNGGKGGIYVYDISSQTLTTLLSDGYNNEYPCYSTDGTKIFFVSDKDDDLGEVYEMDADGSNVRRISFNDKKERFLKFGE